MDENRRFWLNQATHSRVANSTASLVFQGPRRWISSALYKPLMVSARALSELSPQLPTEGSDLSGFLRPRVSRNNGSG